MKRRRADQATSLGPHIAIAALTVCGFFGLLAADPTPSPSPSPPPAAVVHIKSYAYGPAAVTIKPGDAVQFVNDDEVQHSITSASNAFTSGELEKGKTWSHTFAQPGTYPYFCDDHPLMRGTINVKE